MDGHDIDDGARLDLGGLITADSMLITTGADGDDIRITSILPGTETTVSTMGGSDTIRVGSHAVTSNTGGVLNALDALLVVDGGSGADDKLLLDDSGDRQAGDGELGSDLLTGLGTAGIRFSAIEELELHLGLAGDTLAIIGTEQAEVTVYGGAGDDTFNIGDAGTLSAITNLLNVQGEEGTDRIERQ